MGARGPRPKTRAERKLTGNASKRPLPAATPAAANPEPLVCPAWLPDAAQDEWRRIVPLLPGITAADQQALVVYCLACHELQQATLDLERGGRTFMNDKGDVRRNPAAMMQASAMARIKQCLTEFGLSPGARSRLPPPPPPEDDDEMAGLLGKAPPRKK